MKRISLLSDTHSHVDDKMLKFISGSDEIWHAGDIGDINVIDRLKSISKVRAVYGNIDDNIIRQEFNEIEKFNVEGVSVFMTHIGGYPPKYAPGIKNMLIDFKPKIFISGHSHILKVINDAKLGCIHINPGAAGVQGFHGLRTMVRFKISDDKIHDLEVWEHKR